MVKEEKVQVENQTNTDMAVVVVAVVVEAVVAAVVAGVAIAAKKAVSNSRLVVQGSLLLTSSRRFY